MYNEKANRKACFKEAEKEYARRQKEQEQRNSEQNIQREKVRISSKVDQLQAERDKLVAEAVELRRIDPEAAKMIIAQGAGIDAAIRQARRTLATAKHAPCMARGKGQVRGSLCNQKQLLQHVIGPNPGYQIF